MLASICKPGYSRAYGIPHKAVAVTALSEHLLLVGGWVLDNAMEWRYAAARDASTPPAMLVGLYDFADCRLLLAENVSTPTEILEKLSEENAFTHLDPTNRRMAIASVLSNRNTSSTAISRILTWTEGVLNVVTPGENSSHAPSRLKDYFYPSAAGNPNTPVKYLKKFAESDDTTTIFWLLPNPKLPREIIAKFVDEVLTTFEHEELHSFSTVAQNPNLIESEMVSLSRHPMGYVRDAIARNKSTPAKILMGLINDEYFMTRIGCVWNENLPLEGLEYFANQTRAELRALGHNWIDDYLDGVRKCVLKNPHSSDELRKWVATEEWLRSR